MIDNDFQVYRHDHGAYIRGWCDVLDSVARGYVTYHNPYGIYFWAQRASWEAGRKDAFKHLDLFHD